MATVSDCERALRELATALASVDADVRRRRIPARTVSLYVRDLETFWCGRLGPHGLDGLERVPAATARSAQLRLSTTSDEVLAIAASPRRFAGSWVRGHVKVSASLRDLLELRQLL